MSENKFTPGPWERAAMLAGNLGIRTSAGYICGLTRPFPYPGQEQRFAAEVGEMEANAHLIAAAPDLLEACKIALYGGGTIAEAAEKIRAAIAKAEGCHA